MLSRLPSRLRPHRRNAFRAPRRARVRDRCRQRSHRSGDPRSPAQVRFGARQFNATSKPGRAIVVNGRSIKVCKERDRPTSPGKPSGRVVIESTGCSPTGQRQKHIDAGAKKVIISAPAKGEDLTVVMASTRPPTSGRPPRYLQCFLHHQLPAPVAKVLLEQFGIVKGLMTRCTPLQRPADPRPAPQGPAPRPGRQPVDIPTPPRRQGVSLVLPQLKGKLDGLACACRPPMSPWSTCVTTEKDTSVAEVNAALKAAANARSRASWCSAKSRWSPRISTATRLIDR